MKVQNEEFDIFVDYITDIKERVVPESSLNDMLEKSIFNDRVSSCVALFCLIHTEYLNKLLELVTANELVAYMIRDLFAVLKEMPRQSEYTVKLTEILLVSFISRSEVENISSRHKHPSFRANTIYKMFEDSWLYYRSVTRVKLDGEDEYVEELLSKVNWEKLNYIEPKKDLLEKYDKDFTEMRKIVNKFDPMDLVLNGSPEDEHDHLTHRLVRSIHFYGLEKIRDILIDCFEDYGLNVKELKEEYKEDFMKKIDGTFKEIETWYKS